MFRMNPKAQEKGPELPPRLTAAQAEAAIRAKEVELATRELEEEARFRREQAEAERREWREAQAKKDQETKAVQTRVKWSVRLGQVIAMFPITTTTTMAMIGQFGWGLNHLDQIGSSRTDLVRILVVILFSASLESLSLFQGYHADRALQRRDSAFGLYAGAFATSGIVGALNYSHYASATEKTSFLGLMDIPSPTPTAVVFALFSFISPALWRIHSRAKNRDTLKKAGEIDTRAPRLAMAKKLWHPIRWIVTMYLATWSTDVRTPAEAMALYDDWKAARLEAKKAKRAAKRAAKEVAKAPTAKGKTEGPEPVPDDLQEGPAPTIAQRFPEAWEAYVKSAEGGNKLTQRALAKDYLKGNRHHARAIITAWEETQGDVNAHREEEDRDDDDVRAPAA
ncbi:MULTISPECIES: hypothetical protein [unclassified Nonomuraea]|uniref:hypothetical protein n=1 Tax=unclassified Nonomuraea TaxID=2593643 RepID=UPI0033DDB1BA